MDAATGNRELLAVPIDAQHNGGVKTLSWKNIVEGAALQLINCNNLWPMV